MGYILYIISNVISISYHFYFLFTAFLHLLHQFYIMFEIVEKTAKTFFQILSRTWGINLNTIACLFELVDGLLKKTMFYLFFFEKIFFSKHVFLGLSIHKIRNKK